MSNRLKPYQADPFADLAITPLPDPRSPTFVSAVTALARRYGADPGRLAEVLR